MTYRDEIRDLDRTATPSPWVSEGEMYGVRDGDDLLPLGFAPHRPLDSRLIATYRAAIVHLFDAVDAIERLVARTSDGTSVGAAVGIRQILDILDASTDETGAFRDSLASLHAVTTPPLWDPGHLYLGMASGPGLEDLRLATPAPGDAPLIAVARIAVPRALELLASIENVLAQHARADGSLHGSGADAIAEAIRRFDDHSSAEGRGTGTV